MSDQPWQIEGETWRDTQLRHEGYRRMDIVTANFNLERAYFEKNGMIWKSAHGIPIPTRVTDDFIEQIEKQLIVGSHAGRCGALNS